MRKALIIAHREFFAMTTRKAYLFAVLGLPLFVVALIGVLSMTARATQNPETASKPIAIVDRTGLVNFDAAGRLRPSDASPAEALLAIDAGRPTEIRRYDDVDRATEDIRAGQLSVCYVIEQDYLETGRVTAYSREGGVVTAFRTPGLGLFEDVLRLSLARPHVEGPTLRRVMNPLRRVDRKTVTLGGDARDPISDVAAIDMLIGSFGVFFLFSMAIFFSSGYLLQGAVEDRHSRLMELLLSSVQPTELLAGKLIGLGGAGLLQVAIYGGLVLLPMMAAFPIYRPSATTVALSLMYFLLGYVLIATLMAGSGMLGNTAYESGQMSVLWTLTSAIPLMLVGPISGDPNGMLARGLSFFPLTAPLAMLLRISLGRAPWQDVFFSCLVLLAGIYVAVRATSTIFRVQSFMHGKRPTFREITHWLREA
jgi:ABC-2 type transport system permease protein